MIKTCVVCGKEFEAAGKTKICSDECRKNRKVAYRQSPEWKAYLKAYQQIPKRKAWLKAYRRTPE